MVRALPPIAHDVGSSDDLLARARGIAPLLAREADRTERERRVSAEIVAALAEAGIFRMCVPRALGGAEADPATMIAVLETLARADGSAGWSAMIAATSGVASAYLAPGAAREIYGAADGVAGGVYAPYGRATAVEGGYRLSGRWPFASGCEHCTWLTGGTMVEGAGGKPEARLMLFPRSEVEIIDTWNVSGLRGT
ncbi:MAG TPA: acyl-CoA dehydrogenase family protein, partial [Candidatus Binatia bacterium]|nr:acyl-CoA dehydrogenase family protein [Candidatus Binatia bacterium]